MDGWMDGWCLSFRMETCILAVRLYVWEDDKKSRRGKENVKRKRKRKRKRRRRAVYLH